MNHLAIADAFVDESVNAHLLTKIVSLDTLHKILFFYLHIQQSNLTFERSNQLLMVRKCLFFFFGSQFS